MAKIAREKALSIRLREKGDKIKGRSMSIKPLTACGATLTGLTAPFVL